MSSASLTPQRMHGSARPRHCLLQGTACPGRGVLRGGTCRRGPSRGGAATAGSWNDSPNVAGYGSKRQLNQHKTNDQALSTRSPGLTRRGDRTAASSVASSWAALTPSIPTSGLSMLKPWPRPRQHASNALYDRRARSQVPGKSPERQQTCWSESHSAHESGDRAGFLADHRCT